MNERDFLLNAFYQIHPKNKDEFLDYVKSIFGKNLVYQIHSYMCDKYGLPKIGTGRVTYISKTVVFKVPISEDGFRNNDWESSVISFGKDPDSVQIAYSRHLPNCEIPIVVMEKVTPLTEDEIKQKFGSVPNWVYYVDMGQVGLNSRGKLVAFDYADL